jgi:hypothetical protein
MSREFACEHCGGTVQVAFAKLGDEVYSRHCGEQTHVNDAPPGSIRIEIPDAGEPEVEWRRRVRTSASFPGR